MRCARTTPPPPKLTVRATLPGKVSTAQASVAAGSAPESSAARSRTWTGLSIRWAPQVAQLDQAIDHPGGARGDVFTLRVDHQLRRERLLVGIRDARELGDLAGQRAGVQSLGVSAHARLERGLHVHLDERTDLAAHFVAHRAVRGDRRADHDHAVARQQLRHVADATDVGIAVLAREAEAFGEVLTHLVAVQRLDPDATAAQVTSHSVTTASAPRRARTHLSTGRTTAGCGVASDHGSVFTRPAAACQPRDRVVDSVAPAG